MEPMQKETYLKSVVSGVVLVLAVQIFGLDVVAERLKDVLLALDIQLDVVERFVASGNKKANLMGWLKW